MHRYWLIVFCCWLIHDAILSQVTYNSHNKEHFNQSLTEYK